MFRFKWDLGLNTFKESTGDIKILEVAGRTGIKYVITSSDSLTVTLIQNKIDV